MARSPRLMSGDSLTRSSSNVQGLTLLLTSTPSGLGAGSALMLSYLQDQLSRDAWVRGGASSAQPPDMNMSLGGIPDHLYVYLEVI